MRAVSIAVVVAIASLSEAKLALQFDQSLSSWQRPISRVLDLLNDMTKQITKEGGEDEKMYDELVCWCRANSKEKTDAIAEANQQIDALSSAFEEYTAKGSQLGTDLEQMAKDVAETQEALSKASELRDKEAGEFQTEEKSSIQTIGSLKSAVMTLGKSQSGADDALLQANSDDDDLELQPISFLQQPDNSYKPQGGAVFGILKQMKETFETNFATGRDEEKQAQTEYSGVKSAKARELSAAQKLIRQKEADKATADQGRTQSKEDLKAMRTQLSVDTEFLRNVQLKCEQGDKEYEARKTSRSNELNAISDTVTILTNDSAQQTLDSTSTFLQTSQRLTEATKIHAARRAASEALSRAAMRTKQPRLSMLAIDAKQDPLAKVKQSIDTMMQQLKVVQSDEAEQKDLCVEEFNQNDRDITGKTTHNDDLEQSVADLAAALGTLEDDLGSLKKQIFHTKIQMKKATTMREQESRDFQTTVSDQRATQTILTKAVERLKAVYNRDASLIEESQQPPDQGSHKKNGSGQGVVYMIENIVRNSQELEAEAKKSENDAQASYEIFLADCSKSIQEASRMIASKTAEAAGADQAKTEATNDLIKIGEDLETLGATKNHLHGECDYLLKNFEERQSKRAEEINGLLEAKAIFSGTR